MKELFNNKWVRFGASLFGLVYTVLICSLTYLTFMYRLVFKNLVAFGIVYVLLTICFFAIYYYSRKQVITTIVAMLHLPIVFGLILFNIANPIIFIPPLILSLVMFFSCKLSDTAKTLLGTFYLLMYFVGLVAFFLFRFLSANTGATILNDKLPETSPVYQRYDMEKVREVNENSVSPDGKYRFYIVDIENNSRGEVHIFVEPNDMDSNYRFFTLYAKGMQKRVAISDKRGEVPDVKWVDDNKIYSKFKDKDEKVSTVILPKKDYLDFLLK